MASAADQPKPVTLFYSYSHKDEGLQKELNEHLASLERIGLISPWHDREINAGVEWKGKIDERLDSADLILLLISSSFINSEYCYEKEMRRALERHKQGKACVIPIILRPCRWEHLPIKELQILPKDALPVTKWQRIDDAFNNVVTEIQRAVEDLQRNRPVSERSAAPSEPLIALGPWSPSLESNSSGAERRVRDRDDPALLPDLTVFKEVESPWCPEMVVLPAGEFLMGCSTEDPDNVENARPQHQVSIQRFAVGGYPVTFDEYDHFCAAVGRWKPNDQGWGRGRRPVINVTWNDAKAYCEWLTAETGEAYRLPTESEWEYACRAGTTTRYAFGDRISTAKARYGLLVWSTAEVGCYQPNLWGLFDMHGNVDEWVEDVWHASYVDAPRDGRPWLDGGTQDERVARGGGFSWAESTRLRSYSRARFKYMESDRNIGFRIARTLS